MPVLKKNGRVLWCFFFLNIAHRKKSQTISPKMKFARPVRGKSRCRSASLTVEAALAFSIFFFTVYLLWQLFLFLLFQVKVCQEITETVEKYSHLGYAERLAEEQDMDISWLYQPILWTAMPEAKNAESAWVVCIPEEEGAICVKAGYDYSFASVFFAKIQIPVRQTFRFYPYIGKTDADKFASEEASGEDETKKDIVYVTEYGTVYHESRACGYLNVVVRAVPTAQIGQERNSSGRKYTLCERCRKKEAAEMVYISEGGERYHLAASCPGLKRTVLEKERAEVADMPACHKCGAKSEEDG